MLASYVLGAVLSLVAPSEEPPVRGDLPVFGQRGQLVLHGSTAAAVTGYHVQQTVNGVTAKQNQVGFTVEPSAGVFVIDNLLVGGLLNVQYQYASSLYNVSAGIGPYVGYRVPMGPAVSFLPTFGAVYSFVRNHENVIDAAGTTSTLNADNHLIYLRLHADFLFHLAHRVSMTAGPFAHQSVYDHTQGDKGPSITTYGLQIGVLGWL